MALNILNICKSGTYAQLVELNGCDCDDMDDVDDVDEDSTSTGTGTGTGTDFASFDFNAIFSIINARLNKLEKMAMDTPDVKDLELIDLEYLDVLSIYNYFVTEKNKIK